MPKITDIQFQKRNKQRANVYIDGEFAFGVEMLTVMQMGLKTGNEVSQNDLKQAVFQSDVSVAFGKAVDYLARAMKTERQMRTYLSGKGYGEDVVDVVMAKLKDYGYVDDKRYAKLYVEQNCATKGEIRLKHELTQKGVGKNVVETFCEQDSETSRLNATHLAEKYMRNKPCDKATLAKLQRYLLGRGYNYDVINAVVAVFKNKCDENFDDEYC